MNNQEIIGYLSPTDLFDGAVKKGDIYVKRDPLHYYPQGNEFTVFNLPKEIVEEWDKAYKYSFKVGDWVYAEEQSAEKDYRMCADDGNIKYIPTFQIKEIVTNVFDSETDGDWLRPASEECSGVLSSKCRLATNEEIEIAQSFKPGTIVAWTGTRTAIGEVIKFCEYTRCYSLAIHDDTSYDSCHKDYIRLATDEEATKYREHNTVLLNFGDVRFTINKGDNFATTTYGKITLDDIEKVITYLNNPPSLCGYNFNIFVGNDNVRMAKLDDIDNVSLGFGCQKGQYSELIKIKNALTS